MNQNRQSRQMHRSVRLFSILPLLACHGQGLAGAAPAPGFYTTGELSDGVNTLDALLPPDAEICIAESSFMPAWAQQKYDDLVSLTTPYHINGIVMYRSESQGNTVEMAAFSVMWVREEVDPVSRKPNRNVMPEIIPEVHHEPVGKDYYVEGMYQYNAELEVFTEHHFGTDDKAALCSTLEVIRR